MSNGCLARKDDLSYRENFFISPDLLTKARGGDLASFYEAGIIAFEARRFGFARMIFEILAKQNYSNSADFLKEIERICRF